MITLTKAATERGYTGFNGNDSGKGFIDDDIF